MTTESMIPERKERMDVKGIGPAKEAAEEKKETKPLFRITPVKQGMKRSKLLN